MTAFFQSEFFYNYRRSSSAMIGSALMAFFALAVLLGPFQEVVWGVVYWASQ